MIRHPPRSPLFPTPPLSRPPAPQPPRAARARRHRRAHQVGTAAPPLPPLEVPVGGRGAALAGLQNVGVHAEAHRAPRVTPLEARLSENPVQSLALRLDLDLLRPRNHQGAHVRGYPMPAL